MYVLSHWGCWVHNTLTKICYPIELNRRRTSQERCLHFYKGVGTAWLLYQYNWSRLLRRLLGLLESHISAKGGSRHKASTVPYPGTIALFYITWRHQSRESMHTKTWSCRSILKMRVTMLSSSISSIVHANERICCSKLDFSRNENWESDSSFRFDAVRPGDFAESGLNEQKGAKT